MNQIAEGRYKVVPGEVVTVELLAIKVGDTAVFTAAPADVHQIVESPRKYQFTVGGNPGETIFGAITCDFTAADDGASFHAVVSSASSGPFPGPTINKDDPDSEQPVSLDFEIP